MNTTELSRRRATGRRSEHGRLTTLAFGLVLVLGLHGCGGSSTGPTPSPSPVVSFAGTWSGTFTASNCGHTGSWPSCAGVFDGVQPMTLTLSQTGSSVTGTLRQSDVDMSVTGSVSANGHLLLNGSATMTASGVTITFTLVGWDTQQSGNSMTGGWNDQVTAVGIPGFLQWINTINTAVRASANPATAASASHAAGTFTDSFDLVPPGAN